MDGKPITEEKNLPELGSDLERVSLISCGHYVTLFLNEKLLRSNYKSHMPNNLVTSFSSLIKKLCAMFFKTKEKEKKSDE